MNRVQKQNKREIQDKKLAGKSHKKTQKKHTKT